MNIIEAIKSGRRIRRAASHEGDLYQNPTEFYYSQERILADDWEVEPEAAVEITYSQLRAVYNEAFNNFPLDWESAMLHTIARSLGLLK